MPLNPFSTHVQPILELTSSSNHLLFKTFNRQHGKSTLCDKILRDCSVQVVNERMMDSGDLERERGITITSKVTTVEYNDTLLNVVDSPGHSEYVAYIFPYLPGQRLLPSVSALLPIMF